MSSEVIVLVRHLEDGEIIEHGVVRYASTIDEVSEDVVEEHVVDYRPDETQKAVKEVYQFADQGSQRDE